MERWDSIKSNLDFGPSDPNGDSEYAESIKSLLFDMFQKTKNVIPTLQDSSTIFDIWERLENDRVTFIDGSNWEALSFEVTTDLGGSSTLFINPFGQVLQMSDQRFMFH